MQVATLFRETAKLLGASMDGSAMDNSKYCMKPEAPADDGYETCLDAMCVPLSDRLMGGPHHFDPGMRHGPPPPMDPNRHERPGMNSMKMEQYGDPYSFVDEMPNMDYICNNNSINSHSVNPSQPKKRGRRKKSDARNQEFSEQAMKGGDEKIMDAKERKRHDRFNGLTEEEVSRRTLPDHLTPNLDVIIVGINPGMFAAFKGHHYAGPGNHFWKCLYLSGLVPEPFTADDDFSLLNYGIGFTNMVARPTKGSADLTRREIKQGSQILLEKLQKYRPKIAVFNGKLIYEVFSGKKDFPFGRQSEFVDGTNTYIWVMPSSSARCAQLPRAADKVPFYMALKKFRDYLNGLISEIDESEVVFHEPKASAKNANAGSPTDESNKFGDKCELSNFASPDGESSTQNPVKKKRGRPRKGMEKNSDEARASKVSKGDKGNKDDDGKSGRMDEPQRKRRGRPKKVKPVVEGSPANANLGNQTPEGFMDRGIASANNASQTQKASSVSSGYSTGTTGSTSSEDRCRRDENGSLSNAGSSGLSPSHHSFTTQSDLSSEISAAISCGSCPPSPLNNATNTNSNNNHNQTETVFDGLSMSTGQSRNQDLTHHNTKQLINAIQGNNHDPPNCNNLYQPANVNNVMESHESYPHTQYQPTYDNRFHHVSNRSQSYIPSNSRNGEESSMQPAPTYQQNSYETKCLDITSKSLSGLESLVDQIPSIAEAEANGSVSSMSSDPSNPHSQAMPSLPNATSSVSHGGHFGESSAGFLPYGHHVPPSTYAAAPHYASSPYYASELSASFPVNSLSSAYCSPTPSLFGYPSYHGQYSGASGGGYGASSASGLHLPSSPYGNPSGYPASAYSGPNPYMQGHSMTSSSATISGSQRYSQRTFHLRQDGMDLGPLGFGGF